MFRRIVISIAAASSAVLLMASISPAHAVSPEITFVSPVGSIKHVGTCKHGSPPCDTFKVTAPFNVTNDVDLDDDLSNQKIAVFFGSNQVCDSGNSGPVFEAHVEPGQMVVKTSRSHVKYSFKGMTDGFSYNVGDLTVLLNLSISINTNTGKGVLKASGTGDFAAITTSPALFALIPFLEPDADNDPNVNNGDFNCGVMSVKLRSTK